MADSGLPGGWYQVSITAVLPSGEESGAPAAALVQLQAGQFIRISGIPSAAGVDHFRLFVSKADDDVLHWAIDVANGINTVDIDASRQYGEVLATQYLQPLPHGEIIRSYRGRVYVLAGHVLHWSDALRYGLYDPRNNFLELPGPGVMLEPAENGLYLATNHQTFWVGGDDPKDHRLVLVDRRGAVPGSAVQAPPDVFPDENVTPVGRGDHFPCWMDTDGVQVVGYPSGRVRRITAAAHVDTNHRVAAAAYLEQAAGHQILTILKDSNSGTSGARATDRVTSRVTPP